MYDEKVVVSCRRLFLPDFFADILLNNSLRTQYTVIIVNENITHHRQYQIGRAHV